MTNFGIRTLTLSAVGTAFLFSPLAFESQADDAAEISASRQLEWTVSIGPKASESATSTGIVISPSRHAFNQSATASDDPILVGPVDDKVVKESKPVKKPEKRNPKKADKAPVATETASQKAHAEWQKKRVVEPKKRQPKSEKPVASKKAGQPRSETGGLKVSDKASDKVRPKAAALNATRAAADARKKAMAARAAAESKAAASHAQDNSVNRTAGITDSRSYREIYNSIPFSRAEYDANPGYRHQATMEIMLGQLHPIIVAPPAPPRQATVREVNVRFLPSIRPGYRAWSSYPWH